MATDCSSNTLYGSLEFCPNQTVLPGMAGTVYFIPKSQIVSFPSLPALTTSNLTMAAAGTLEGNFTLAADAKFMKIDILTSASNVSFASQGEKPSKTFLNSATLKYAGNNAAAAGFCRSANADDFVYIVQQRDGQFRVLGNKMFDTNTNLTQESGSSVTDASGTTIEVSVTDEAPAPFFTGVIKVDGGYLNCATGEVTTESPKA